MVLAKAWDKINKGMTQNISAHTCFLSPQELQSTRFLFGELPGLYAFGGFSEAERKMLIYLPEYLDESALMDDDSPIVCLHADFNADDMPTHRDFLGALMGMGIGRETVGDICVGKGWCDFFVTEEIAPYLLLNFTGAGCTRLRLTQIRLSEASIPQLEVKTVKATLASLRLDAVIAAGFHIGRSNAVQAVSAGKVSIDGLLCEKPDKTVPEGAKISLRGSGKIRLIKVNGQTKKGRISVDIHRYM